ncbi:PREDICTED: ewing's tumor-associated antigen 1 [Chrysochloris asiatica]|uniref:Ewing's tumor-associated antigen 1 n=1 Tax=Chrysochloris asiatica TaxID=185453 RepID=A0A9B0TI86_CHRAS|nr:PREDICTED: ewing's tumor-associated antigen 1 [Chrysochloris asiatica]
MSRRRKHGDGPGPKDSLRKTAATEECSSVEPGRRRPRSTRGSGFRGAGDGPPPPMLLQEQPPAAASCSKSNPEEKYETPRRVPKIDLLPCNFSSPNDPDGLNDIFWDQNSPTTKLLGKGRKNQIYTTDSDEISHIVNRIAPQDERPSTNSMLGIWIGETAIPCTPSVTKGKSRAKSSGIKLKTQNQEEELMKLAKQFDKNMEELDVIQEQSSRNHDFAQMISETETLNEYKENLQIQSLCHEIPEIDTAVIKKPVKESTKVSTANDQNSSNKLFDQNVEAAFNAIFDGSTQKCSGCLSQDRSDAFLNTSNNTACRKENTLKEEKVVTSETLIAVKLQNKAPGSLSSQVDTPIMTKSCVTSCVKETETFSKHIDPFAPSDFEKNWEQLRRSETLVMQTVEMPELLPVSKVPHVAVHKDLYIFNNKNDKSKSRTVVSLDARLNDSKILQNLPSKTCNKELIDAEKHNFLPDPNDKSNKLSSTGNKMKFEQSCNKIIFQDKIQDCALASKKIKEDTPAKFTSTVNASEKKSALNKGCFNEQKCKPIFNQSVKIAAKTDLFDSTASAGETKSDGNPNQTNAPHLGTFLDDWNDPSFANEVIEACHQLENTWETDDVDDDLLYQACDDVERLTQQQTITNESKIPEKIVEVNNNSKFGAKNMSMTSKQGRQLMRPKHLNLDSLTVQPSITNSSQVNQSVKMEKGETSRNTPSILGTTTNLTMYSKNSNDDISNMHVSWNNSDVPVKGNSSKLVLAGSSSWNVSSGHMNIGISAANKLTTQRLLHRTVKEETQTDLNKATKFSKYTFTRMKNSQTQSQFNQSCLTGSKSGAKTTQSLEEKKTPTNNPLCDEEVVQQQSLIKLSESVKQPSKEEEEKNRKYSPEEIQRKRQEALVRRMAKIRASSLNTAPT